MHNDFNVLLYFPCRRGQAIQNILVRYCILGDDPDYLEKETFLLNDLGIPMVWIHESKVWCCTLSVYEHFSNSFVIYSCCCIVDFKFRVCIKI